MYSYYGQQGQSSQSYNAQNSQSGGVYGQSGGYGNQGYSNQGYSQQNSYQQNNYQQSNYNQQSSYQQNNYQQSNYNQQNSYNQQNNNQSYSYDYNGTYGGNQSRRESSWALHQQAIQQGGENYFDQIAHFADPQITQQYGASGKTGRDLLYNDEGHFRYEVLGSAWDNYSNQAFNYNKHDTNYNSYDGSASIWNKTPDWNQYYGSSALDDKYSQNINTYQSSWDDRTANWTESNYQQTGAYYYGGADNSYFRSSNTDSINYDSNYVHYDIGRHTVSEYDYYQYDTIQDDVRYQTYGSDKSWYQDPSQLYQAETYFDAGTAQNFLDKAYDYGYSLNDIMDHNQGPDVWSYATDYDTGNTLLGDAYLSKDATEYEQAYFDVGIDSDPERRQAWLDFDVSDFGKSFTDTTTGEAYHFDAFGDRVEGETSYLAIDDTSALISDLTPTTGEASWVSNALKELGANSIDSQYNITTADGSFAATVLSDEELTLTGADKSDSSAAVLYHDSEVSADLAREVRSLGQDVQQAWEVDENGVIDKNSTANHLLQTKLNDQIASYLHQTQQSYSSTLAKIQAAFQTMSVADRQKLVKDFGDFVTRHQESIINQDNSLAPLVENSLLPIFHAGLGTTTLGGQGSRLPLVFQPYLKYDTETGTISVGLSHHTHIGLDWFSLLPQIPGVKNLPNVIPGLGNLLPSDPKVGYSPGGNIGLKVGGTLITNRGVAFVFKKSKEAYGGILGFGATNATWDYTGGAWFNEMAIRPTNLKVGAINNQLTENPHVNNLVKYTALNIGPRFAITNSYPFREVGDEDFYTGFGAVGAGLAVDAVASFVPLAIGAYNGLVAYAAQQRNIFEPTGTISESRRAAVIAGAMAAWSAGSPWLTQAASLAHAVGEAGYGLAKTTVSLTGAFGLEANTPNAPASPWSSTQPIAPILAGILRWHPNGALYQTPDSQEASAKHLLWDAVPYPYKPVGGSQFHQIDKFDSSKTDDHWTDLASKSFLKQWWDTGSNYGFGKQTETGYDGGYAISLDQDDIKSIMGSDYNTLYQNPRGFMYFDANGKPVAVEVETNNQANLGQGYTYIWAEQSDPTGHTQGWVEVDEQSFASGNFERTPDSIRYQNQLLSNKTIEQNNNDNSWKEYLGNHYHRTIGNDAYYSPNRAFSFGGTDHEGRATGGYAASISGDDASNIFGNLVGDGAYGWLFYDKFKQPVAAKLYDSSGSVIGGYSIVEGDNGNSIIVENSAVSDGTVWKDKTNSQISYNWVDPEQYTVPHNNSGSLHFGNLDPTNTHYNTSYSRGKREATDYAGVESNLDSGYAANNDYWTDPYGTSAVSSMSDEQFQRELAKEIYVEDGNGGYKQADNAYEMAGEIMASWSQESPDYQLAAQQESYSALANYGFDANQYQGGSVRDNIAALDKFDTSKFNVDRTSAFDTSFDYASYLAS